MRHRLLVILLMCLCAAALPDARSARAQNYTLAVREVPLDEALQQFVDATGEAVSYEPALVRGRSTSCVLREASAQAVLACILRGTGLDYHRLSSGTFVLAESVELAPVHGFLAGRVVDEETGSPLAGAHVQLADAGIGAVTDPSGRFTFPALLPGSYTLSVRHLGYRAWRERLDVHPREQVRAEAKLSSEPILITPVIVDGTRDHGGGRYPDPSIVADAEAAAGQAAAGGTTYRHIQSLAGVRLNEVTADAHVQGGDAGSHQLRLDGVPVFLPRSVAGLVGPFGSFAVDRIRVHRAGFGASHGSHLGGVIAAEHALATGNDADVQADPYSLNARVRLSSDVSSKHQVAGMVSARRGLWDVMAPGRLKATLESWAQPDPFILLAPMESIDAAMPDPSALTRRPVNPSLHYSDVHAAGRVRFGPLRSLSASIYHGGQRLEGGILTTAGSRAPAYDRSELVAIDEYDWQNLAAQIGYDAVLGRRTLASVQVRISRYDLQHRYETVDSLDFVLQDTTLQLSAVSISPVEDGNRVSTMAVEGVLDHARDRHQIRLGAETGLMESRFDLSSVHFSAGAGENRQYLDAIRDFESLVSPAVRNASDGWYAAAFGEDRVQLGSDLHIEAGIRLTYLHVRRSVYAEPRAALIFGGSEGLLGTWSGRTSAGLYRQFLNQTDASQFSTGVLLPSVRVWLPVDATVRPPVAYHLAQELQFQPLPNVALKLDGYLKLEPHGLTLAYATANAQDYITGRVRQREFLAGTSGTTVGGTAGLSWQTSHVHAEISYSREHSRRESAVLFDGRRHAAPWVEPHRLQAAIDWLPGHRFAVSTRWKGVWGRSWGFRQVYYDYFGHHDATRLHGAFDLGDPSSHALPPLYQLDVGAAYTLPLGPADLQIRAELLNVLDRDNVLDWRLVREGDAWRKEARTLYPMMPSVAARLRF